MADLICAAEGTRAAGLLHYDQPINPIVLTAQKTLYLLTNIFT